MKKSPKVVYTCTLALVLFIVCAMGLGMTSARAATPVTDLQTRLGQLQLLLQSLRTQVAPLVKGVSTVVVTTDAELANAIKNAKGGDTIQLAPGNYGTIQLLGGTSTGTQIMVGATVIPKAVPVLASAVTITSQTPTTPAVVKSIDVRNSNRWHFKALSVRPVKSALTTVAAVYFSGTDLAIEDSTITYGDATAWTAANWVTNVGEGIAANGTSNLIRNNYLKNVYMGISIYQNATSTKVINNTLDGIGGDGIRVLSSSVTVDGNLLKNFKKINTNQGDCMQSWGQSTTTINQDVVVNSVVVQNNLCLNNESTSDPLYNTTLQGFGSIDSSAQNWTVKNNVFIGTGSNGMVYAGAVGMKFLNNTVIDADPAIGGSDNVLIRVIANKTGTIQPKNNTFQNNLSNKFTGFGSTSVVSNNIPIIMSDYGNYFRDWRRGDVRLLSTSPLQNVGANIDPAVVGYHEVVIAPVVVTPAADLNLSFNADADHVLVGESINLTWEASAVTSCVASGGWSGDKDTSGSEVIDTTTLRGLVTFSIRCEGPTGAVSQNISVAVSVSNTAVVTKTPRPTVTFTATPASFTTDESTVLTWSSTNATACTASGGWSGTKETSGTETISGISVVGPRLFSISCAGPKTRVAKNIVVQVSQGTGEPQPTEPIEGSASTTTEVEPVVTTESSSTTSTTASPEGEATPGIESATPGTETVTPTNTTEITLAPVEPTPAAFITTGVAVLSPANVRATPNGKILGTQPIGATGTLGNQAALVVAGTTWVYVNFNQGFDGYVAKQFVKIIALPSASALKLASPVPIVPIDPSSTTALAQRLLILKHLLAKRLAEQK